ncbi:MAG: VWA domain-containing protein, partial [Candidatus Bipolaricaulota bacterium]|nr:VWA domain-containing protein [Candidatus Bipolaricaulota bacterium]MDW8127266.1 VWA domain-containing protein [Candidatus Bipolaricaulota bacterium]
SINGSFGPTRELTLRTGIQEELFPLAFSQPGIYWLDFSLDVPDDPYPQNNRFSWVLTVGEIPPILVVGEGESAVDSLLTGAGLPFCRVSSLTLQDLSHAGVVILDDYPLGFLGVNIVEGLRAFLAQGGGLWVIQGRQALTGYAGPVEEILPLTFSVPQAFQEAQATIVFVLDRSASMAGRAGSMTKLELLKEAAAAAAELIPDQDWLGAIAFDRTPLLLVSPAPASHAKLQFFSALAGLTPSGGTDVWPAVELALAALSQVTARIRHIILVSDGKTVREARNFQVLYDEVRESGVGLTAIAIGPDADLEVLSGLAQAGGGQVVALSDPTQLRAVLVQETRKALRPRFLQGEFAIVPGPAAGNLSQVEFPKLLGYSLTFPKPTAEVALLSSLGDPLLVFGRLGLGRVAVLNTDLRGIWSRELVSSPALSAVFTEVFARLWSERQAVEVSWDREASSIRISLDVAQGGRWVQGLKFTGTLTGPNTQLPLSFRQTAPGRYEAEALLKKAGVFLLSFAEELGRFGGTVVIPLPYSLEFAELGADMATLRTIARLTGGTILEDEELPTVQGERREWVQLWPAFLWASAGSFLLDLSWRKLRNLRRARV